MGDNEDRLKSIRSFALQSRLFIAVIQVFFNYLIPDHDAKVFSPPTIHRSSAADHAVVFLLGGFRRWDAIYFLHIAEYGYTYENTLVFFPLFPFLTRIMANTILLPLHFIMNYSSCLLVAAFLLNLVLFVMSADILFRLSRRVIVSDILSFKAAQLYCVNPASIFFSAPYSETTFALLTFSGLLSLETNNLTGCAVLFGASSLARSNGLINCAFIWYKIVKDFLKDMLCIVKSSQKSLLGKTVSMSVAVFAAIFKIVVTTFFSWLPFLLYQFYSYKVFCNPLASYKDLPVHVLNYGNNQKYKMPHTGLSPWCHQSVPISYSYVQSTHWDVGFLHYYELKQIPNFVLALPMICLSACAVVNYIAWNPVYFLCLGLYDTMDRNRKKVDDVPHDAGQLYGINRKLCYVYVVHIAAMTIIACLFMHIQVLTRFIASSCPVIYWFVARMTVSEEIVELSVQSNLMGDETNASNGTPSLPETRTQTEADFSWNDSSWFSRIVLIYFHMYLFVGVAAFSNFLPWT